MSSCCISGRTTEKPWPWPDLDEGLRAVVVDGRGSGLRGQPNNHAAIELRERAAGWCRSRAVDHRTARRRATTTSSWRSFQPPTHSRSCSARRHLPARRARRPKVDVPILGVNLGKIGFLSKVEAHELEASWPSSPTANSAIEERMAARGHARPAVDLRRRERYIALNDVVVARGALARVCRLDVEVGESHLATFIADGLVVASPTGPPATRSRPAVRPRDPPPEPGGDADRRIPVGDPLGRRRRRAVVRCRVVDADEALVSIDGREDLPVAVGDVVEVRAMSGRSVSSSPRAPALLGPRPPQGGAAAVVSHGADRGDAGRLLELTVDRPRAHRSVCG